MVIAEVPGLPGRMTHGDTYEEALVMAQEAMRAWIDVARELGRPVPEPKGRKLCTPDLVKSPTFRSSGAV